MTIRPTTTKNGDVYCELPMAEDDARSEEAPMVRADEIQAEDLELGTLEIATSGEDKSEKRWTDFWTCCLFQGLFGPLGPLLLYCLESHRKDYPTPAAFMGCLAGVFAVPVLYLVLMLVVFIVDLVASILDKL